MPIVVVFLAIAFASACIVDPATIIYSPDSPADAGRDEGAARDSHTPDTATSDVALADTADTDTVLDATDTMDEDDAPDASRADVEHDTPDTDSPPLPTSCSDLIATDPNRESGVYTISPIEGVEVDVFCDMNTDGRVGYTMLRIDAPDVLLRNQDSYRATCEALGMEVIVPKTRGHARSITRYNNGRTPNLINVFPRANGARGLENWEGRCQGQPCSFYVSDTNNSNCTGDFEPSGDNSVDHALYSWRDEPNDSDGRYCFGGWNDENNTVNYQGFVICSTNDTVRRVRASCNDYLARGEVYNVSSEGISGLYTIEDENGPFEVYCDMSTDEGGWTLVWKNTGDVTPANVRNNQALWSEAAAWTPGQASAAVLPVHLESASAVDYRAWHYFLERPHLTWTKFGSLYRTESRERLHSQSFHLRFGANRLKEVIENRTNCHALVDPIEVYVNGRDFIGRTRHLIYSTYLIPDPLTSIGLATTTSVDTGQTCGQPDSELINDPSPIVMLNNDNLVQAGSNQRTMTYVFSYGHNGTDRNRNRCMYSCWSAPTGAYYDAFVWGVRGPLTYDSCAEVRRLDPAASSGQYLVDEGLGPQARSCTF